MGRYLIIQTAFLGDTILVEPLVETLKVNDPSSEIGVLITPDNEPVFSQNNLVDYIITYDKSRSENTIFDFFRKVKSLRAVNFDVIISPHRSFRSALLAYLSGSERRIGFRNADLSVLYTDTVKRKDRVHEVDRNLSLVEPLGFDRKVRKIKLYYSRSDEGVIHGLKEAYGIRNSDKIVVVNPTSTWPTKRWPKERFRELAKRLAGDGYFVVLIGKDKDSELMEFIRDGKRNIVNVGGNTTLKELFAIIDAADLLISNDSAPIHIASAFNTPTVEIFGPTLPEFGFTPLSDRHRILEVKGLSCRPCGKHGGMYCRKGHFRCMMDIGVDEVYRASLEMLS